VLGGAPGIFSARWAGHGRGDAANRDLLLDQLADLHDEARGAAFACTIAFVVPPGDDDAPDAEPFERVAEGLWRGSLVRSSRGANGFGYDPIFVPAGLSVTAAELSAEEKNARSHRSLAFEKLIPLLRMSVIPN
jgi:XTP/dITP diphosphohydrolase